MTTQEPTSGQAAGDYMGDRWYTYYNDRLKDGPKWQARTVRYDDLIASAYTREHIDQIVRDHNAASRSDTVALEAEHTYDAYCAWMKEQDKFDQHDDSFAGLDNLDLLRAKVESEMGLLGLALHQAKKAKP